MRFNTPLRYPGGKGKLTQFFKSVLEENDLIGGDYVEAFAGGAGIAINLLIDEFVSRIHINDLNSAVHAFWYSVLYDADELCKMISSASLTMENWHKQKEIMANQKNYSSAEVGFATFFLNRTNRSGILLGGVIGGKKQDGKWLLDSRFKKAELISRIERIANLSSKISLYNLDAIDLIDSVLPKLPKNTLAYFDPPYYVKGKTLYQNYYMHRDHFLLSQAIDKKLNLPWIVSYDHTPEIVDMYKFCKCIGYEMGYSAQKICKGSELMFFSNKLDIKDKEVVL